MSRIRGIEVKVKKEFLKTRNYGHSQILKRKREEDLTLESKDDEQDEISELLAKLPQLNKIVEVHRKIGEGTFSSVYLGSLRQHAALPVGDKPWFAIKHLVPTAHPARVEHELRCLRDIGGKENVIGVDLCLRNLDTVVFLMPYIPHRKFSEYVHEMDAEEVRCYMRALLTALRHVHSFSVIHRDVKPSNFLYDRDSHPRRYLLVDFGLAQRLTPTPPSEPSELPSALSSTQTPRLLPCACSGRAGVCGACWARPGARAPRAGTQGYRPPEVLLKVGSQGPAVDVWASGVVLASALTARYPFFRAGDDVTALAELADLLGTRALGAAARALGRRLVSSSPRRGLSLRRLAARLRGAPLSPCAVCLRGGGNAPAPCLCLDESDTEAASEGSAGFPSEAFKLAARLLAPDPRRRPTAAEALKDPFLCPPSSSI